MNAVCHPSASPSTSRLQEMFQDKVGNILPRSFPVVRSVRKWTPAKIRLRVASCAAAEKLLKELC
jgi:hypothetical protein